MFAAFVFLEDAVAKGADEKINPLSFLLMGGHICVDMAQGGLAAVLPFLVLWGGYSYAQVTMLILAANIASAVIQPLFGWLGDKTPRPWLMAVGVFLAGIGMAGIGVLGSYWLIVVSAMVSGIGIAMLHPEGGRLANLVGGKHKAKSMSIFSVGGQVGFCVGPVVTVAALSAFGLAGTLVFLVFGIPFAVVLIAFNAKFAAYGLRDLSVKRDVDAPERWGAFTLVLGALSARSIIYYAVTSFVPLFMVSVFSQTEQMGSSMITLFAAVGALATLLSGRVAERVHIPYLMIGCYVVLVAGLVVFAASPVLVVSVAVVMALAVCVNLFNPPAITLGQEFVPKHLGMASGLSFGVAVCVGGVVSPMLGALGDACGLCPVMWAVAGIATVGLALSCAVACAAKKQVVASVAQDESELQHL